MGPTVTGKLGNFHLVIIDLRMAAILPVIPVSCQRHPVQVLHHIILYDSVEWEQCLCLLARHFQLMLYLYRPLVPFLPSNVAARRA
jgi:hypothetical protein